MLAKGILQLPDPRAGTLYEAAMDRNGVDAESFMYVSFLFHKELTSRAVVSF